MMQPISGTPARPPGEGQPAVSTAGEQPLSTQQRTVLERLITRLISLTQQQSAEVWAGMKHDLGVKSDTPLLSRHFPAAEQNLNQRLGVAQQNHANRQVLSQLTELLTQGNNRQAVSDFIRQQYGQTALSQLKPEQLKNVLTLLQQGQLSIPQPQQRPATDRPLLPAEHNTLNQLVTKLAAATGESSKLIWQSMLELSGVKSGELIPAKQFTSEKSIAAAAAAIISPTNFFISSSIDLLFLLWYNHSKPLCYTKVKEFSQKNGKNFFRGQNGKNCGNDGGNAAPLRQGRSGATVQNRPIYGLPILFRKGDSGTYRR